MKNETIKTQIALMKRDVEYIKSTLNDLKSAVNDVKKNTEDNFVTKAEFTPVKTIAYAVVGLVLTTVVGALLSLILK